MRLAWSGGAGALSYRIFIDDQPDFSSPAVDGALVTSPSYAVILAGVGPWYWKVTSHDNDSGTSTECDSTSDFGSFLIDPAFFSPGQYVAEWTTYGINNPTNVFSGAMRSIAVARQSRRVYVQDGSSLFVYNSDGTLPSNFVLSRPSGYHVLSQGDISATQEGSSIALYYLQSLTSSRGTNRMIFKVYDNGAGTLSPAWVRGHYKLITASLSTTPSGIDSADYYNLSTDCSSTFTGMDDPDLSGTQRYRSVHAALGNFASGSTSGIAISPSGMLYVGNGPVGAARSGCSTTYTSGRVEALNSSGTFVGRYYRQSDTWQFHPAADLPLHGVAANGAYIFTSEYRISTANANRIHRMSLSGAGGSTSAYIGGTSGNFGYMSTGPDGRLYAAYYDAGGTGTNFGIWVCSSSGDGCQLKLRSLNGCSNGSDFIDPVDVEVDADGFIYVADRGPESAMHNRIVKFAPIP